MSSKTEKEKEKAAQVAREKAQKDERWYRLTFGKPIKDRMDFYRQGRLQFTKKNFELCIHCIEIYIAGAAKVEVAALHLLASANKRAKNNQRAFECFLGCVRLGLEDDWQRVVEILLDIDEEADKKRQAILKKAERKQLYKDVFDHEAEVIRQIKLENHRKRVVEEEARKKEAEEEEQRLKSSLMAMMTGSGGEHDEKFEATPAVQTDAPGLMSDSDEGEDEDDALYNDNEDTGDEHHHAGLHTAENVQLDDRMERERRQGRQEHLAALKRYE